MTTRARCLVEVRERAVHMVFEHQDRARHNGSRDRSAPYQGRHRGHGFSDRSMLPVGERTPTMST